MSSPRYGRFELKYFVHLAQIEGLVAFAQPHIVPDKHATIARDGLPHYEIESVYLDTQRLRLYQEKMDGLRDRRKLRVRRYPLSDNSPVFYEIKYRFNTQVMKDRARFDMDIARDLLEYRVELTSLNLPLALRRPAERFMHLHRLWNLVPVVIVRYDRIAFVGQFDERIRFTIDTNLRYVDHRYSETLFEARGERPVPLPGAILELKFDRLMPEWMRELVRQFDIRLESISKYAYCIEAAGLAEEEHL